MVHSFSLTINNQRTTTNNRRVENVVVYRMLCQLQIEIDKHTLSWTATVKPDFAVADQPLIKQCSVFTVFLNPEPCDLNSYV